MTDDETLALMKAALVADRAQLMAWRAFREGDPLDERDREWARLKARAEREFHKENGYL